MSLEGGRERRGGEGRGREEKGGREGRDDCYTYSNGATVFKSRHVLRNNVVGIRLGLRRTMVRNYYVRRDVDIRSE